MDRRGAAAALMALSLTMASAQEPLRTPARSEAMLSVQVNLEAKGDYLVLVAQDGDIYVREEDLPRFGLGALTGQKTRIDGAEYVSLRSLAALHYQLDMDRLVLSIRADARALTGRQVIDLGPKASAHVLRPDPAGSYFNYNVTRTHDAAGNANDVAGEVGARLGRFLFSSDAYSTQDPLTGTRRSARLSTSLTRDDRETLERLTLGDFVGVQPGPLASSLRLGGVSFSRRFSIDPYYVRFPGQVVAGTAALPSEVFVYSNGVLVRRERVAPGGFELQNLVNVPGLQLTEVVVRDVLGNEQRISDPFYYSESLLRPGLSEYSFDAGVERRQFGIRSADYGKPGFTAFYRRGLTSGVTLGGHAEGLDGRGNFGPGASLGIGDYGVLNAHFAHGRGNAWSIAHGFHSVRWSTNVALKREERDFERAAPDLIGNRRYDFAAAASHALTASSGVSLTVTSTAPWDGVVSRSTALGYRRRMTRDVYLSATARHTSAATTNDEIFLTLSWHFDAAGMRHLASAQARRDSFGSGGVLQFSGGNPEGEGLVYRVNAEARDGDNGSGNVLNPLLQWNARRAVLRAEHFRDSATGNDRTQLGVQGGIAAVGGEWALSRPVADSFAIVKVGSLPGVRVYANNQPVGTTDSTGTVFVPRLASYFENPVAVEDKDLPVNYIVPRARFIVAPALRSGVFLDFNARAVTAIAGRLLKDARPFGDAQGELVVGVERKEIATSRDGSFYVEQVPPGSYEGTATRAGETCRFRVQVAANDEVVNELGEVQCVR
jgi:outer membrane usher protein